MMTELRLMFSRSFQMKQLHRDDDHVVRWSQSQQSIFTSEDNLGWQVKCLQHSCLLHHCFRGRDLGVYLQWTVNPLLHVVVQEKHWSIWRKTQHACTDQLSTDGLMAKMLTVPRRTEDRQALHSGKMIRTIHTFSDSKKTWIIVSEVKVQESRFLGVRSTAASQMWFGDMVSVH